MKRFKSTLIEKKELSPDVYELVFLVEDDFLFVPGQYIIIPFKINGKKLRREYSIVSFNNKKLKLCVKKVGVFSNYLCSIHINKSLEMIGPLGVFRVNKNSFNRKVVFISTGTGIAPFPSMIGYLLEKNKNQVILFSGFRTEKDSLYQKEVSLLDKKHSNFSFSYIFSNPTKGTSNKGRVQDLILNLNNYNADYYLCGLNQMVTDVVSLLLKKGVDKKNIFFEKYS